MPSKIGSIYGYVPTEWVCVLFVVLFGLSTTIHLVQALRFRLWFILPTIVLGGLGEVIGWAGRLWSSKTFHGNAITPYLMQISSTIIAPTPIVAANFIILGTLIQHLGNQYSRLSPARYTIVFCSADAAALIVQAIGGASASRAAQTGMGNPNKGGHIMLAGIVVQLVAIAVYASLAFEFLFRYYAEKPVRKQTIKERRGAMDHRIKLMIFGLCLSTLCIFIRAIYRTIELSDGWSGRIIRTQVYFNVLDGAMICIAVYTLNVLHPGFLLSHIDMNVMKVRKESDTSDEKSEEESRSVRSA